MKNSDDSSNIYTLYCEGGSFNIENGQPGYRTNIDNDSENSTTSTWGGITDPAKGPNMYTPTVDEEEVSPIEKIKKLIQMEIKRTPEKMTYASRVLKKLLKTIESV